MSSYCIPIYSCEYKVTSTGLHRPISLSPEKRPNQSMISHIRFFAKPQLHTKRPFYHFLGCRYRVLKFFFFCLFIVRCTSHGSHLIPYPQYAIRHTLYEFIYVFAIPFRLKPHKLVNGTNKIMGCGIATCLNRAIGTGGTRTRRMAALSADPLSLFSLAL